MNPLKTTMKAAAVAASFLITGNLFAQTADTRNFMPVPQEVKWENEKFRLDKDFNLSLHGTFDDRLYGASQRFLRRLQERTGIFLDQRFVTAKDLNKNTKLIIEVERAGQLKLNEDESYTLDIAKDQIVLKAVTDIGALRGLETLLQTLASDQQSAYFMTADIQDEPRFPWRGLMLDVSRHFHPIDVVKRQLDAMAAMKMNVFHFHLSDDHGFRVESKVLPNLHEKASEGEYFTQNQIREIIEYADQRGIRVMPEFDMPGHGTAMILAYPELASSPFQYMKEKPELSPKEKKKAYAEMKVDYTLERHAGIWDPTIDPTKESSYALIKLLIDEMTALFPDEYFHIGGDENEYRQWADNDAIQAFMKENNIPDHHMLQNYFNTRLLAMIQAQGKKMMGWDEILVEGLPKDAIIQSWRGKESLFEAAKKGYTGLLSNGYYIDLMHSAESHYIVDPLDGGEDLTEEQQKSILGGEATMWSELITSSTIDSRVWPRTAAIAERLWSSGAVNDVDDMYRRLEITSRSLEEFGLRHLSQPEVILRNIARSSNIDALKVLTDIAEPLEHYNRNPLGLMYSIQSPFTLFADACIADAPKARVFNKLVEAYLNGDISKETEIKEYLKLWVANHAEFMKLRANSQALAQVEPMSENLSKVAQITLESFEKVTADKAWYQASEKMYVEAHAQQARTVLQVVAAMEKLFKKNSAVFYTNGNTQSLKVDANLMDWNSTNWTSFTSEREYVGGTYASDSVKYAIQSDTRNLYIALDLNSLNILASKTKGKAQDESAVELSFKNANGKNFNYYIAANNKVVATSILNTQTQTWKTKAKAKVKVNGTLNKKGDRDKAYVVEVMIPLKDLGVQSLEALEMNIKITDMGSGMPYTFDYLMGTDAYRSIR